MGHTPLLCSRLLILGLLGLGLSFSAKGLTVIQASTQIEPLAPYLEAMGNDDKRHSQVLSPSQVASIAPQSLEESLFPLTSPLTPGVVPSQTVHFPYLTQPIFVIGDDDYSLAWLSQHSEDLRRLKAIGLMTNVASAERYEAIEAKTGWTLLPVSLEGFNQLLAVDHLPFLVTANRLWQ